MPQEKTPRIRTFEKSDLESVKTLIDHTIDVCYCNVYCAEAISFFKQWHCKEKIRKAASEGWTIVLEINGLIVATGTLIDDEIVRVFVDPTFQKQGLGMRIMVELEAKALSLGISTVKLDASIPAKVFYDFLGYVTLEETFLELENSKRLDYWKMQKNLQLSSNINATMRVRQATKADCEILMTIIRNAFREIAQRFVLNEQNCPKSPAFYNLDRLEADFKRGVKYFILESDGVACGCAAIEKAKPDVCYLERLAVLPEHRGRGFGKVLANHIIDQARKLEAKRVEIGIIAEDTKIAQWYSKLGFVHNGTKNFDHLPFVVGFMTKKL